MRLSVLIPTKNRLEYLRYAVESVRRQEFDDWEAIVADNRSEQDVEGFVRGLGDERVRYVRTDRPLPVTENWNFALSHSTGDYVLMLGDDDALLRGHLGTVERLARAFSVPDLLYTSAWLYAYPQADPAWPAGYLMPYGYARFLRDRSTPFLLDPATARRLVDDFLAFRCVYGYNAQFMLLSRSLINRLRERGPVYQSPFPDYYAANAAMLAADGVLVVPSPLVVIGVTPKSYGHFHHEGREAEGTAFLGQAPDEEEAKRLADVVLPGTNINTSWLFAAERLRQRFADLPGLRCRHRRYRNLQILDCYEAAYARGGDRRALAALRPRLRPFERLATRALLDPIVLGTARRRRLRTLALARLRMIERQYIEWNPPRIGGRHSTILEVVDAIDPTVPPA